MFSESVLGFLGESSSIIDESTLDPRIAEITLEAADDIYQSPAEHSIQAMMEFRMNMMAIDTAAVCEEYSYLKENGVEMVNESVKDTIKSWFTRAKDAIVALGKRIAEFFRKVLHNIEVRIKGEVAFVKKYKEMELPSSVTLTKSIEGTDFEQLGLLSGYKKIYSQISASSKSMKDKINGMADMKFSAKEGKDARNSEAIKKMKEETITGIVVTIPNMKSAAPECTTIEKFKKKYSEVVNKCKKMYGSVNVSKCLDTLSKTMADRKAITECFNLNKKIISDTIKTVEFEQAKCDKDSANFAMSKNIVTSLNLSLNMMTAINGYVTSAFEARRRLYKQLVVAASKANKSQNPKYNDDEYADLKEGAFFGMY